MAAFIDKAKVKIVSGRGGNGCVAWRREKFVDKGGPAGGDGGCGGSVYLVADENMATLLDFSYKSVFRAQDGENGKNKNQHGQSGSDLYLKVPIGVIVRDLRTNKIIADLNEHQKTVLVAKGGRGGRGNARFATAQKRSPQFCEPGEAAVEREFELELKLIADVGLLGMPNAGKSSFISVISSARPKIADYPFTTLVPNLGVVKKPDGDGFVVADIPGLVEGASQGVGLGYEFLRHIQRCRFFVHIVDMSLDNPLENYLKINSELQRYDSELLSRRQILVLNKKDIVSNERVEQLKHEFAGHCSDIFVISCATSDGVRELLGHLFVLVDEIPRHDIEIEIEHDFEFANNDDSAFEIIKLNKNTYNIIGGKLKRLINVTDIKNVQQVRRLSNIMDSMGVWERLKAMGAQNNDTIIVEGVEMIYTDMYY